MSILDIPPVPESFQKLPGRVHVLSDDVPDAKTKKQLRDAANRERNKARRLQQGRAYTAANRDKINARARARYAVKGKK
jgi:hypothetical protein